MYKFRQKKKQFFSEVSKWTCLILELNSSIGPWLICLFHPVVKRVFLCSFSKDLSPAVKTDVISVSTMYKNNVNSLRYLETSRKLTYSDRLSRPNIAISLTSLCKWRYKLKYKIIVSFVFADILKLLLVIKHIALIDKISSYRIRL